MSDQDTDTELDERRLSPGEYESMLRGAIGLVEKIIDLEKQLTYVATVARTGQLKQYPREKEVLSSLYRTQITNGWAMLMTATGRIADHDDAVEEEAEEKRRFEAMAERAEARAKKKKTAKKPKSKKKTAAKKGRRRR